MITPNMQEHKQYSSSSTRCTTMQRQDVSTSLTMTSDVSSSSFSSLTKQQQAFERDDDEQLLSFNDEQLAMMNTCRLLKCDVPHLDGFVASKLDVEDRIRADGWGRYLLTDVELGGRRNPRVIQQANTLQSL
ncbi:hypothetical protein MPSEU_000554000 [Mayamaea pseudoterrestris]|nr:hypothetical protein MPSEU_000554000 [Mayamaea pseudoterrestris]